jgi:hypothetical protein
VDRFLKNYARAVHIAEAQEDQEDSQCFICFIHELLLFAVEVRTSSHRDSDTPRAIRKDPMRMKTDWRQRCITLGRAKCATLQVSYRELRHQL